MRRAHSNHMHQQRNREYRSSATDDPEHEAHEQTAQRAEEKLEGHGCEAIRRFQGMNFSTRASAQVPVSPANMSPAPTNAATK